MEQQRNPYEKDNRAVLVSAAKDATKGKRSQSVDPDSKIRASGMHFNDENADRFWEEKHGIVTKPVELVDAITGDFYDNGKWKAITQHENFLNQVSRMYVVFPNEEVIDITYKLLNQDDDLEMLGEPKFTNHGLNLYITIISKKHKMIVESSDVENDEVNLGVIVRNSLGGGLALGTDTFTYRRICFNGAVFGYNDLGSDSMRHYGKNVEKITRLMRETITRGLGHFEDIHKYYEKLATSKLGEKSLIFGRLFNDGISAKYFPTFVDIDTQKITGSMGENLGNEHIFSYSKDYANTSLWSIFNDFTKGIWHSKDLRMDSKRFMTKRLHQVLIETAYGK